NTNMYVLYLHDALPILCAGHPDKLCDLISDSILDACLVKDKVSRVACEVLATKGRIIVAGEISCSEKINLKDVVKSVLVDVGYRSEEHTSELQSRFDLV